MRAALIAVALLACGDGKSGQKDAAGSGGDGPPIVDAPKTDGPLADSAVLPGPACQGTTCMLNTEECCLAAASVCKPAGTCPSQGFLCDGTEDCSAGVCCYPNSGGSRCQTNSCQQQACHIDGDCPSGAAKCCPKTFAPPGYGVCQAAC